MVQVHKSAADDIDSNDDNGNDVDFVVDAGGAYTGAIYEVIQFEGNATGGVEPYNWSWDFGDGSNATQQNPQHSYSEVGEYTIILTVTDASNETVQNETSAIIVNESEDEFTVNAGDNYEAKVDEIIQFLGSADGGVEPYNWSWDFGDSNISYEQNPQHAYSAQGVYDINLSVLDNESILVWDTTQAIISEDNNDNDNSDGEWYTIKNELQIFDLIALQNVTDILGEKKLTAGKYTQIRLIVEKAEITINNSGEIEVHNLKIPSNNVKLIKAFWIYKNETTILTLDFDIYKSVHKTGSNKYIMKPTIKVIQE
jgi:PKD repeat protein